MCLRTTDPTIRIAEEDIICYKSGKFSFSKGFTTYAKGYSYGIRGTQQPKIEVEAESGNGYPGEYDVNPGYHTHDDIAGTRKHMEYRESIHMFLIPKGTKYISGFFNNDTKTPNRVSETLVWLGRPYNPLTYITLGLRKLFSA